VNPQKIKKIKDQLEFILKQIVEDKRLLGVDVDGPVFKRKMDDIRGQLLEKFGIKLEDYNSVDDYLIREQTEVMEIDGNKKIFQALRQITAERTARDFAKDLMNLKIRLANVEKKKPLWEEINNKPSHVIVPYTQDRIKDLPFRQLSHTDEDHRSLTSGIKDVKEDISRVTDDLKFAEESLKKSLTEFTLSHKDLLNVGPDDHHAEKHILESHLDSDLMEKVKRLVNGDYVDDLHKHAQKIIEREVAFGGWVTSNDNIEMGEHYLEFEEISTPSNPATDKVRMYAKDDGGTTKVYTLDSAGTETELGAGGSGGFTELRSTETPDGTNTIFTFTSKPAYIISGGAWYEETEGWIWDIGLSQATLSVPPPTSTLKLLGFA